MARKATELISRYPKYVKDHKKLVKIMKKIKWIKSRRDRETAMKKYPIMISTAGMLGGGPAINYLKSIRKRTETKVLITCFQPKDAPGHNLLENGLFKSEHEEFKVKCDIQKLELSYHADRSGLFDIIRKTNPETVITVHGDNCKEFSKSIEKEFPTVQAYAPKNGEEIKV